MTTIAIIQSCYIPWKGYFDLIRRADLFILYDCVQYTSRDWRNRNRIKTAHGTHWLTIPVVHTARNQLICDTRCAEPGWRENHWKTLHHAYSKAPRFSTYAPNIKALYDSCEEEKLSHINLHFLRGINAMLGIATPLILLEQPISMQTDKSAKLIDTCKHYGASNYLSGSRAQAYLNEAEFARAGIKVQWMRYDAYEPYEQLYPPFLHEVSIIDRIFHVGLELK